VELGFGGGRRFRPVRGMQPLQLVRHHPRQHPVQAAAPVTAQSRPECCRRGPKRREAGRAKHLSPRADAGRGHSEGVLLHDEAPALQDFHGQQAVPQAGHGSFPVAQGKQINLFSSLIYQYL